MLKIQKNILLSKHTTFRIGGEAKFFAEAGNGKELKEALEYATKNKLKVFVLAGGSNVLFSDEGFDGLVIKLKTTGKNLKLLRKETVEAWAGTSLSDVVNFARDKGLIGMENLAGVPGTIGGAVRGNASAFGTNTGDLVTKVETVKKSFSKKASKFGYRTSIFKEKPELVIVSVILKLKKGDKKEIEKKMKEIVQKRMANQPKGWKGSAGSFFKNPEVKNKKLIKLFEKETGKKVKDGKLPAGWLIAEAGFLGRKIGGAEVSEKHGNFLINTGKATAQDIIMLASIIKQKVRCEFGVELQEEIQYVEF
jgi:UDP-N-acetylmuramate dehydrogenase